MTYRDCCKILEIDEGASPEDIKKAYRKMALKYHPDRNKDPGSEEKFKQVINAYEKLTNKDEKQSNSFEDIDLSDIFSSFFNISNKNNTNKLIRIDLQISLEDAYRGKSETISYQRKTTCECLKDAKKCKSCKGYGYIRKENYFGVTENQCNHCFSTGKERNLSCSECKGASYIFENKEITIKINEGIEDGQKLLIKGQGNKTLNKNGDVLVVINIKKHPVFNREDAHLVMSKEIKITQFISGTKFTIKNLAGQDIEVTVPANTKPNTGLRIPKEGMRIVDSIGIRKGDLFIELQVAMPKIKINDNILNKIHQLENELYAV